jgi:gamma-glutamyltranspeptidase/glutathione hydrolase
MLQTARSYNGMVVAPHHLAAQAGLSVLKDGGNAIEAMVAAAATIAVVYPHMNGIGGDGFWLIGRADSTPVGIQGCGRAASGVNRDFYATRGLAAIPARGPLSALTVAGTVSGWEKALEISAAQHGGRMPLKRLLEDAIHYAREGVPVAGTLHINAAGKFDELRAVPGFAETYLVGGAPIKTGARLQQLTLADTLDQLAAAGLSDFYRGDIARALAVDLEKAGSPLRLADLESHTASVVAPLSVAVGEHTVFNLPPPTQGLASLLILALYANAPAEEADTPEHIHRLVEATKAAFRIRNDHVTDPDFMRRTAESFLTETEIARLAAGLSETAAPWPDPSQNGDTVWLSAADSSGLSVSFIQSIYWEFGSGLVLPETGITWQNRGTSFSLDENSVNALEPGRLPFHTIQPAMSQLDDGRLLAYGTMGGEGQPQTQGLVFTRHVLHGQSLQASVSAPRFLLGRTWGETSTNLKLESRFEPALIDDLRARGHEVEVLGPFEEKMGHAGAIALHPDGLLEGASDPRSDGTVAAW